MAIRLRVTWDSGRSCTVRAERAWSAQEVKEAIARQVGVPPGEQRLYLERRRGGRTELPEERALGAVQGYAADISLARCHPRKAEWLQLVALDGEALGRAPRSLQADVDVVLAALRQSGCALAFAPQALRDDREVVRFAVRQHAEALEFASDALKADWEMVLAAMELDVTAIRFAAPEIRGDRELALGAVASSGCVLEWLEATSEDSLRADREVVLRAVAQNGAALQFASEELREDHEVVLAAVRENAYALEFAGEGYIPDEEVMQAALGDVAAAPTPAAPAGEVQPRRPAPAAYAWMGCAAEVGGRAPPRLQPKEEGGHDSAEVEELDERQRLHLATHWRLERGDAGAVGAALVHRWAPDGVRLPALPACASCLFGRHLWCPRCGPAAMPEASLAARRAELASPAAASEEARKVRVFLGDGLCWSAHELQACAFKGVPP